MEEAKVLKPCPFCGGKASVSVSDDEGNQRNEEYENDPWSGLSYQIKHDNRSNIDCPIAGHAEDGGIVGTYLYDSRKDLIAAWNKRF
ncbi:Lar-like restriction alleviation protein [Bacillus phage BCASJ1c]|uniref:28 n=1 Tax=Bacillus phage BCASJ1c TaxID=294382 RepID=Q5YA82_9CAUD|nr:Lar-like restriction alleviation protein [Bacillus phage BCASJ1c]AAU85075.1 28 [Bacillus phage BCASJ1c]